MGPSFHIGFLGTRAQFQGFYVLMLKDGFAPVRVLGDKQLGFNPNGPVLEKMRTITSVGVRRVG
eukprot:8344033-Pyramimonas_sp.AAC.1